MKYQQMQRKPDYVTAMDPPEKLSFLQLAEHRGEPWMNI